MADGGWQENDGSSVRRCHLPSAIRHLVPQTRRRFGGRQPLCGIGVTSLIDLMSSPDAARARMADSRPAPGPFTFTSTVRTPCSCASWAAFCAATCAAKGVPLRDPLKPMRPALDQARMFPIGSLMATMVLLNVAAIEATACGTFFRSFFLVPARRAPAFGARAVAMFESAPFGSRLSALGSRADLPRAES